MNFDFDRIIERRGTDSLKWRKAAAADVIPMWVADMDFAAPPCVMDALRRRVEHGVFGYAAAPAEAVEAVVAAMQRDYAWTIDPSWIVWLPGVVPGLAVACRMLERAEDAVASFVPIYPPFISPAVMGGHPGHRVPLVEGPERFEIDFERLDAQLPPDTRMLLWCHPQNPTGRVFGRDELARIAELCLRREMILVSDEIHCGLLLEPGARHLPTAALSPEIAARTITLMAPSKTFNVPGLGCSFAVIPDATLRRRFRHVGEGFLPPVNPLGFAACTAAYRDGEEWRAALCAYLRENRGIAVEAIRAMAGLRTTRPEATYLAWIDGRGAGLEDPAAFFRAGGVELFDGRAFGAPGWVRLNFGCPRATLFEGLRRMRAALMPLPRQRDVPSEEV